MKYSVPILVLLLFAGETSAQVQLPIFRAPVQLPSTLVNSASTDYGPSITGDGLTLYWASSRTPTVGLMDVWMATRFDLVSPWMNAAPVAVINTTGSEQYTDVRDDDLEIFVSSTATGGQGLNDIWVSSRNSTTVPFSAPLNLAAANSTASEDDPTVTGDGLELYFVSSGRPQGGQGAASIYRITRPSLTQPWSTLVAYVSEIDSTAQDHSPSISADGLTIIWASLRTPGTGSSDLYIATRIDRNAKFSTPQELKELNTIGWEHNGQWSADGFSYYFTQNASNNVWRADRILPRCLLDGVQAFGPGVWTIHVGQTLIVHCRRDPNDIGIIVASLSSIPPIGLPGVQGLLEINPGMLIMPPKIGFVRNNGCYSIALPVPNIKALNGVRLHFQCGVQDQGSPPQLYLSNRMEMLILAP